LVENDDAMTLTGEVEDTALQELDTQGIIDRLATQEGVAREDITVIAEEAEGATPPGLCIRLNLKVLLEYYNQRILSREALIGLLGSFGIPAPVAAETR
jgi:hypothetical protein